MPTNEIPWFKFLINGEKTAIHIKSLTCWRGGGQGGSSCSLAMFNSDSFQIP